MVCLDGALSALPTGSIAARRRWRVAPGREQPFDRPGPHNFDAADKIHPPVLIIFRDTVKTSPFVACTWYCVDAPGAGTWACNHEVGVIGATEAAAPPPPQHYVP